MYPVWPWVPGATNRCFVLGGEREELREHPVGVVEQVLGQVVARVDEPGGQAAAHAVDDRPCGGRVAPLEGQQVDVEDLVHECKLAADPSAASRSAHRSSTCSMPTLIRINPGATWASPAYFWRRSRVVSTPPRLVAGS